jgi:hypothetical protein
LLLEIICTCLPVKPWQMTLVSLLIQTLAEADMARTFLANWTGLRTNILCFFDARMAPFVNRSKRAVGSAATVRKLDFFLSN